MKSKVNTFGITVFTALIIFSLTAATCFGSGKDKSGGSESIVVSNVSTNDNSSGGDVIFSLDKVSSKSFTITVDGANWLSQPPGLTDWDDVISALFILGTTPTWEVEQVVRTSNRVLTCTLWEVPNEKLTFAFGSGIGFTSMANGATDGGMLKSYKAHPTKNSVTLP